MAGKILEVGDRGWSILIAEDSKGLFADVNGHVIEGADDLRGLIARVESYIVEQERKRKGRGAS